MWGKARWGMRGLGMRRSSNGQGQEGTARSRRRANCTAPCSACPAVAGGRSEPRAVVRPASSTASERYADCLLTLCCRWQGPLSCACPPAEPGQPSGHPIRAAPRQVGATPEGVEKPRCLRDPAILAHAASLTPADRPTTPTGADVKVSRRRRLGGCHPSSLPPG